MKKILILVSMLLVAAACAAPPTNQPTLDTNKNTNLAADTSGAAMTEADAIAKEKAVWEAIKQKDYTAFADMLADDQVEVLSEGVRDKAGSIAGVKVWEPAEVNFSEWKFLPIDKDGFIVAYNVAVKGKYRGKDFPLESYRCGSAWVRRNNKWLAIFHQECPAKKPMPPPPAAKAASSPAAKPETLTTSSDPIANEKVVWDLFRSKNYDAFGTLLAPEFLAVGTDGYHDKAGTIKGVSSFDASKVDLSDFKAVKLNDSSSLVTYMTKDPTYAPKGERNTSIWVDRNGKWMALFHQGGTPVKPDDAAPAKPAASPAVK
jgi:hypothetical protein